MLIVLGVVLAMLVAYLMSRLPGPTRSAEVIIDQSINLVWHVVTDNNTYSDIIQGAWYWGPFDRNTARAGTSFKKANVMDETGKQWDYYIVNWEPVHRFSMGGKRSRWDFDFYLTEYAGKTKVRFTRRFNAHGFWPSAQSLVDYTTDALNRVCNEFASKSPQFSK
jgi:hypothetical protein